MEQNNKWVHLFIIFSLGLAIYANIFTAPFHFDDYDFVVNNPAIKNIFDISRLWSVNNYHSKTKLITFLTFSINYAQGGDNAFIYHVTNVLLHICAAIFVYFLVLKLCLTPAIKNSNIQDRRESFALFASLLFLVHPLQTQTVTYIWSRSEIVSTIFCLSSIHLYLKGRLQQKIFYFIAAFVVFFVGIFSRGNIIILPLLLLLFELSN